MDKKKAIPRKEMKIFKLRNRSGYAVIYRRNITEGRTSEQAYARMLKAVRRKPK